jgi:hypothetical protein
VARKRKGRVLEYRVQVAPGPNDPDVAAALLEWLARPPRDATNAGAPVDAERTSRCRTVVPR